MRKCDVCLNSSVEEKVDFGLQPICNRFLKSRDDEEMRYPFAFGQCQTCGAVQNIHHVPASALRPPFDWITYNEPEGHLDDLCEVICQLPGIEKTSLFYGVSFKDDTLLRRINAKGFENTWRIDPEQDLNINIRGIGVETVQECINPNIINGLIERHGCGDVVIARHILEHANNPETFINALLRLAKPNGYIILEVPDCSAAIEYLDYTTFWEEHFVYFTPGTFKTFFDVHRLARRYYECFKYAFENSLVAIGQRTDVNIPLHMDKDIVRDEIQRGSRFFSEFANTRHRLNRHFRDHFASKGKIALFGAGHLACTYINLFELDKYISFVADDNEHKAGLYMPGSRVPIKPSTALVEEEIKLCCLSLSPEIEDRVVEKNSAFLERGGVFASIFSRSARALRI